MMAGKVVGLGFVIISKLGSYFVMTVTIKMKITFGLVRLLPANKVSTFGFGMFVHSYTVCFKTLSN